MNVQYLQLLILLVSLSYHTIIAIINTTASIVVITGCSSGIGKALALAFANNKYKNFYVYATMRDISKWDELPRDNLSLLQLDVTDDISVDEAIKTIIGKEGKIDILINNAGYGMAGVLESVTIDEAKDLFEVNVWGMVRVTQNVLPTMRLKRWGHIINISSTSGIRGIPAMEMYTGSKFALEGISDSMRYSLAPYNISVTNVNAGPIRTKFTDRFGDTEKGGKGSRVIVDDEGNYLSSLVNKLIIGLNNRMKSAESQTSEEMAQVVVNLAILKIESTLMTDVPFNFGTNHFSQELIGKTYYNI